MNVPKSPIPRHDADDASEYTVVTSPVHVPNPHGELPTSSNSGHLKRRTTKRGFVTPITSLGYHASGPAFEPAPVERETLQMSKNLNHQPSRN
jgi:hypothetical protein